MKKWFKKKDPLYLALCITLAIIYFVASMEFIVSCHKYIGLFNCLWINSVLLYPSVMSIGHKNTSVVTFLSFVTLFLTFAGISIIGSTINNPPLDEVVYSIKLASSVVILSLSFIIWVISSTIILWKKK